MEDKTMQSPQMSMQEQSKAPGKNPLRVALLIAVIIVAIASIIALAYVIVNFNGVETVTDETFGTVTITDDGTTPSAITIKSGESVTWINDSSSSHSLEITSPNIPRELEGFGSDEPILQEESYSFIFEAAGTFTYDDPSNPSLIQGTIVVEE
ncbi:MAG: cupredoxin domain-containing protein [Candidatus Woesebacteria bacterium]|jgi:plastocyanin